MDIVVMYCTVPNKKQAEKIAKTLVKHKLAACVSIVGDVISHFSWEGEMCKEKEFLLIIKTRREFYSKIKVVIEKLHDYNVPEIISLPIVDCSEEYLKWLIRETEHSQG